MNSYYIGIDPGKGGAIAVIGPHGIEVADCPMIGSNPDYPAMAATLAPYHRTQCHAVIEAVSSFGMGRTSAFTFGANFGSWQALMGAYQVPYSLVSPTAWKRALRLPRGAKKDDSRAAAIRLYPEMASALQRKKDHGRAEAILLAHHCQQIVIQGKVA